MFLPSNNCAKRPNNVLHPIIKNFFPTIHPPPPPPSSSFPHQLIRFRPYPFLTYSHSILSILKNPLPSRIRAKGYIQEGRRERIYIHAFGASIPLPTGPNKNYRIGGLLGRMSTFAYLKGRERHNRQKQNGPSQFLRFLAIPAYIFSMALISSSLCRPCQLVGFQCVCAKNSHPKLCFLPRPWPSKTISPTKYCLFPMAQHAQMAHTILLTSPPSLSFKRMNLPADARFARVFLVFLPVFPFSSQIFLHLMLPAFSHSLNSFHSPPTTILAQPIPSRPTGSTEKTKRWRGKSGGLLIFH